MKKKPSSEKLPHTEHKVGVEEKLKFWLVCKETQMWSNCLIWSKNENFQLHSIEENAENNKSV